MGLGDVMSARLVSKVPVFGEIGKLSNGKCTVELPEEVLAYGFNLDPQKV